MNMSHKRTIHTLYMYYIQSQSNVRHVCIVDASYMVIKLHRIRVVILHLMRYVRLIDYTCFM